ncbi:MAG TPA: lysozyme [Propionibacteriaceae bacterium]
MISTSLVKRRLAPAMIVLAAGLAGLGTLPAAADVSSVPTPEARRAGVQLGNAQMGWRQHADHGLSANSADARTKAFVPTGVLGMDVASYQGKVNWSSWAKQGRQFAYVKATEGTTYRNPYFSAQYTGSAKVGMIRGAYHFASPSGKSGKKQAQFFVANGGGWTADGKTLPGVLDIEYNPYGSTCYGLSKAKMVSWINDFVVEYKRLTTRDAVIYTTTDWWTRCTGNTTKFALTNPLWAARYGTKTVGILPGGWPRATFWQYTSSPLDQNRFSAGYDRLVVLATKAK